MMSLLRYWGQPTLPSLIDPRHHRWLVLAVGAAAQASFAAAFAGLPVTGVLMRHAYAMSTGQLGLVLGCMALGVTSRSWPGACSPTDSATARSCSPACCPRAWRCSPWAFLAPDAAHMPSPCNWAAGWCWWACWGQRQLLVGPGHHGLVHRRQARPGHEHPADGIPAGGAIGAALLPWVAQHHGFRTVFATLAAFCVLTALLTWLFLHERPHPAAHRPAGPSAAREPSPLRRPDIWRLAIACGLLTAPQIAVLTFGGVYLHDRMAAGLSLIAGVLVLVQISGSVARIVIGQRSDRGADRRRLVRGIGLLAAGLTGALALFGTTHLALAAALVAFTGLAASAWHGVAYTEIAIMAGPSRAGTALGIIGMTIFASAFLTPVLIPSCSPTVPGPPPGAASPWPRCWRCRSPRARAPPSAEHPGPAGPDGVRAPSRSPVRGGPRPPTESRVRFQAVARRRHQPRVATITWAWIRPATGPLPQRPAIRAVATSTAASSRPGSRASISLRSGVPRQ
jgi:hypothetical protein